MSEDKATLLFGRKRRANAEGGARQKFYKVKVTSGEQAQLEGRAIEQRVTVPRLMVESALATTSETITERRQLAVQLVEIKDLLANLANNANQLAKFANTEQHVPDWADGVMLDYTNARPVIMKMIEDLIDS